MTKRTKTKAEYGLEQFRIWLDTADRILRGPPTRQHTVRPVARGALVARFVLPLELCKTTNMTRGAPGWKQGSVKTQIKKLMDFQEVAFRRRVRAPAILQGRPQVFCVRFDNRETDAMADWAKAPVDYLVRDSQWTESKTGAVHHIRRLGYIYDDAPKWIELVPWQEYVPHNLGFVYIAIYTGEHA